jgi:hypothetical protein
MATEEIAITAGLAATAYVAQKLFGKTLEEMGDDLNRSYKSNRDKLLSKAAKKVRDPDDGATPNLRVARDVVWNGAVTDDEVCAEYFGGLLASSRSTDGKDDSALIYVDCIKALSSKQLHLHYIIYTALQDLLIKSGKDVNPGQGSEIGGQAVWMPLNLVFAMGLRPDIDLNVLHRQGLLSAYSTNVKTHGSRALPYMSANPTTFGILLYAAAMNALPTWSQFGKIKLPVSDEIACASVYASTLEELSKITGLEIQDEVIATSPDAA